MAAGRSDADASSDTESVNALLSPSDGFFSQTEVPNEVLLPDPQQRNTQADKEREAREEQAVIAGGSRTTVAAQASPSLAPRRPISASSWRSSIVDTEAEDRDPLIPAAPPAYADIARDTNIRHEPAIGYNTMGQPSSFFPTRSPQDLGGAEQQPLLGHGEPPSQHSWRDTLRKQKRLVKLLVLLSLVLGGLALTMTAIKHGRGSKDRNNHTPGNPVYVRPTPAGCRRATFKANDSFALADPPSFTFLEQHREPSGYSHQQVHITGEVRLQSAPNQKDAVKVEVEYRSNRESVLAEVGLKPNTYNFAGEDAIEVWMPGYLNDPDYSHEEVCLDLDVIVSVSSGISLEKLFLSLQQLDITIEDVDYAAKSTVLNTITGNVRALSTKSLNSREIRIHSATGSISGTYPLFDLLSIDSGTGSVDVHVEPKAADKHHLPAKFLVEATTGSVTAKASLHKLPSRDYQTSITAGTGSISVEDFMHGSTTELSARTSHIKAQLHPVGPLDEESRIEATTLTGTITVGVSPHLFKPSKHMRHLNGQYSSNTAAIQVTHPLQWEGTVRAHTGTGALDVDWPGLSKSDDNEGWFPPWITFPGAEFEGVKGKGNALIEAKSGTGNVRLCGRDKE